MRRFYKELSTDFTQLLKSEYDYNVIVEVGSSPEVRRFKAHSTILYSRSPYFRRLLEGATKRNNITEIKLPHVSPSVFGEIIKYIYSGEIVLEDVPISDRFGLLFLSNEFKIYHLVKYIQANVVRHCESWLRSSFSHVYQMTLYNNDFKELKEFCNNALIEHPNMIFESDDFNILQENTLISILKRDNLRTNESLVWDRIISWGKARNPTLPANIGLWTDSNFNSFKTTLRKLLPLIKFAQISNEDIVKKVYPYKKLFERDMWAILLELCISPTLNVNLPTTDPVLPPPSKKAKIQLPVGQSPPPSFYSIITLQHIALISSWIDGRSTIYDIDDIPYEFILLFKGSKDGFSDTAFHRQCDDIPGTVVIARVRFTEELLGGYNPLTWKENGRLEVSGRTINSFIFSLQSNDVDETILSRVKHTRNAIYRDGSETNGPGFGRSDLRMGSNGNTSIWQCKQEDYEIPIRKINEDEWFAVDEFEVFQVCKLTKY